MTEDEIKRDLLSVCKVAGWDSDINIVGFHALCDKLKELGAVEANEIIFKSCVNLPHWKRSAMRYLKRNVPKLHQQAVNEFNEHPDGRGKI